MDMMEALEWAAGYAERTKLFEVPTNGRGYAVDGAKPPTPQEKAAIVKDLALQVLTPTSMAMLCDHGAILCARCEFIPDSWKALVRP